MEMCGVSPCTPLSRFSGAVHRCPSPLPVRLFLVFVFRAGFLCSVKHRSDNLCDFISFLVAVPGWGSPASRWLSGWPPVSHANGVKRCFPGLLPLWSFPIFSCKDAVEQAVVRGLGQQQQGWKTRLVHWLCHPSSLVMAGDTRATCSHTLYLSS